MRLLSDDFYEEIMQPVALSSFPPLDPCRRRGVNPNSADGDVIAAPQPTKKGTALG
jgi:hypothetical protein